MNRQQFEDEGRRVATEGPYSVIPSRYGQRYRQVLVDGCLVSVAVEQTIRIFSVTDAAVTDPVVVAEEQP